MFLISRTFSRQHPFPLLGKRPAVASNVPSEVPATAVETLVFSQYGGNRLQKVLQDGEQGWYKIVVAGGAHKDGAGGYKGFSQKATYKVYLCPGTALSCWSADANGIDGGPDGTTKATYGGSGCPYSVDTHSQAGAGAGARSSTPKGGGGSGVVAYLYKNSETQYRAGKPIVKQTMFGYSQCPSFVYLDENGEPITLTTAPNLDSDLGYAYTGYIPDPSSTTGGTIAVIGFLQNEPVPYVGQEVKVYYEDDQTVPFYVTTVAEAPKESVWCKVCHGNLVMQGYDVYNTTATRIGYIAAVTQNFRNRTVIVVQYSGRQESYMLDPNAKASASRQLYYGWERNTTGTPTDLDKQTFWTNSSTAAVTGQNGIFMYEKVKDKMCITTGSANTANATRRADLDTVGDTVAFGVTSDSVFITQTIGGVTKTTGTGAYFWLLSGGGSYWGGAGTDNWCAGAALGSCLRRTVPGQTNGYDYSIAVGPSDAFGASGGKDGPCVVIDCNDAIAYDTVDAVTTSGWNDFVSSNTGAAGIVEIYKLSDSTDSTKYAQKIYFPASDMAYTADLKLNDVFVETITIPKSINTVEKFLQDVKQGDVVQITLHGDNGSVEDYVYDITSETIAFGLILGSAPWKIREYKERGDHKLGFSAGNYGCILISGGGAGGGISAAGTSAPTNYGGRGGTSLIRTFNFTNDTTQIGVIHVGKRGETSSGAAGIGYNAGSQRDGSSGGAGGEPTMITFNQNVTVENMPITLYSLTNGSTVMYTQNSYPSTNGKLVQFCDAQGVLNGKTGYKSESSGVYGITCQQDGLFYQNRASSGNPNIQIMYNGETRCIFNEATGGGGGAGGVAQSWRYGSGGAGGGGGGWYRVDMYNRDFYVVDGGAGGNSTSSSQSGSGANGQSIDGEPPADITSWTPAVEPVGGFRGQNGVNSTGGNGGVGYGAGGGAGGQGNQNSSSAFCGAGAGGAPGNWSGGWGGSNNGSSYKDNIALTRQWEYGGSIEYGRGGNGYRDNDPLDWYLGTDGYAYIYRYETITGTTDCGNIVTAGAGTWHNAESTPVQGTSYPSQSLNICTIYNTLDNKWYAYGTVGSSSSGTVSMSVALPQSDITVAPQFAAFAPITASVYTMSTRINDVVVFGDKIVLLDYGCTVFTAPLSNPSVFTGVAYNITGSWYKMCVANNTLYLWSDNGSDNYVKTTTDPAGTWTSQQTNLGIPSTAQVMWDGEKFVCVMSASGGVYTSPDGITWTQVSTQSFDYDPIFIGKIDGSYIVINNKTNLWTTEDLVTWTKRLSTSITATKARAATDGQNIAFVRLSTAYSYYSSPQVEPVSETIDCGSVIDTDITETIDNGVI